MFRLFKKIFAALGFCVGLTFGRVFALFRESSESASMHKLLRMRLLVRVARTVVSSSGQ